MKQRQMYLHFWKWMKIKKIKIDDHNYSFSICYLGGKKFAMQSPSQTVAMN